MLTIFVARGDCSAMVEFIELCCDDDQGDDDGCLFMLDEISLIAYTSCAMPGSPCFAPRALQIALLLPLDANHTSALMPSGGGVGETLSSALAGN